MNGQKNKGLSGPASSGASLPSFFTAVFSCTGKSCSTWNMPIVEDAKNRMFHVKHAGGVPAKKRRMFHVEHTPRPFENCGGHSRTMASYMRSRSSGLK